MPDAPAIFGPFEKIVDGDNPERFDYLVPPAELEKISTVIQEGARQLLEQNDIIQRQAERITALEKELKERPVCDTGRS